MRIDEKISVLFIIVALILAIIGSVSLYKFLKTKFSLILMSLIILAPIFILANSLLTQIILMFYGSKDIPAYINLILAFNEFYLPYIMIFLLSYSFYGVTKDIKNLFQDYKTGS